MVREEYIDEAKEGERGIVFKDKLEEMNACTDAIEWVGDKTFKQAWDECEWADWMLWYICKAELGTRRNRIHIICDCAETALKFVPEGEDRPRLAIEAARKYADERTPENLDKLNAAWAAAWAARDAAGDAAWYAARDAAGYAWAAAWYAAGYAWAAAGAAGDAAWAAAGAARDAARAAAGAAAENSALKDMADMIREKFKFDKK